MKQLFVFLIFLFCTLIGRDSQAQASNIAGQILIPNGVLHGNEVEVKNGDTGLALVETKEGHALISAPMGVRIAHDPILDEDGTNTGKEISAKTADGPVLFWLRAVSLKPAKSVYSAFKDLTDGGIELRNPQIIPLPLATKPACALQVKNTKQNASKLIDYKVTYECGNRIEVLEAISDSENPPAKLIWWGDLNADQKPDLILQKVSHENRTHLVLFLSTQSATGPLLKAAAESQTTGC